MKVESFYSVEHGIIRNDSYDSLAVNDIPEIGACIVGDKWQINQREIYPLGRGHVSRITTYCWRPEDILGWYKAAPGVILLLAHVFEGRYMQFESYYMQIADSNSRQLITLMSGEASLLNEEVMSDAFLYLADHIQRGAVESIGTINL